MKTILKYESSSVRLVKKNFFKSWTTLTVDKTLENRDAGLLLVIVQNR